jgi:hypothetical protein
MRSLDPALVLVVLLAACTTNGEPDPNPDRVREVPAGPAVRADCVVSDPDGEVILHPGTLVPTQPTELLGAALVDAENLEVLEASVVAFSGSADVQGIVRDHPPLENAGIADALADWETRRPLAGLEIDTEDGQQAVLVAVRLGDPTEPGHLRGVQVSTSTSDGRERKDFVQPVLVQPPEGRCDKEAYDSSTEWAG